MQAQQPIASQRKRSSAIRLLVAAGFALTVFGGYRLFTALGVGSGIPAELRRMDGADPVADLRAALAKGDHRFVAMNGFSTDVWGIDQGPWNSLVRAVGGITIKGTSDAISSQEQLRLQNLARAYCERYNKMLLHHLLAQSPPDPVVARVLREIEGEIRTLETSSPAADFRRDIRHGRRQFISVWGTDLETPIMQASEKFSYTPVRYLKASSDLLTPQQRRRLHRVIGTYIKPYNALLLRYLETRAKSKAQ